MIKKPAKKPVAGGTSSTTHHADGTPATKPAGKQVPPAATKKPAN